MSLHNQIVKMKIVLIILIVIVFISCNNKNLSNSSDAKDISNFYSLDNLIESKNKFAFIRSNMDDMTYLSKKGDFGGYICF